jgi:hypothetical protein
MRKIYTDAMMEHLGELAAEAETEHEAAEHFLPLIGMAASKLLPVVAKAVAPMAKRALPQIARAVTRVAPRLTRGVGQIARGLHRNPATRPLLKAVPSIARRTVGAVARQAARGQRVTPRMATRTLAQQTRSVLGHPRRRAQVMRRHRVMDRRFHQQAGRRAVRPHLGAAGATGGVMPGRVPMAAGVQVGAPVVSGAAAGVAARRRCACPQACPTCGLERPLPPAAISRQ